LAVLDHLLAQPAAPTTTVPGPVIQLQGPRAVVLVIAIGVAIAVLWSLPIWLDARRAYKLRMKALDMIGGKLLNAAARDGLKITELRELLATIGEPATGQRGLSRSLMAFTIITVVGVALVALLLSGSAVITSLLSILATIVGFYFGTRAAETGAELAAPEQAPPTQPPPGGGGGEATEGTAEAAAVAGAEEEVAAASGDGAEEPATAPDEEAAAAAMADQEDIEGQLDAGLTEAEASPEELDRQAAADHGELPEAEVDYEMPDEDELQPDEAEGEEAEAGEAKEQP
jgi:hypothetical protein